MSLSALSDELAQVRTKKKEFLTQMDRIIPWGEWIALIRPCYYKGERGNKPYDLERAITTNKSGKRICYKINRRPSQSKHNSNRSRAQIKRREREKSSVRAKVEHVFAIVKQQLRFRKTRYRGLRKQTAKLNILFALANLILADRPCLAA